MLESGSREGEELRRIWLTLKEEEQQAAAWLGRDAQESLSVQVECVGGNSCDGSTRGKISEERDKTWANLITKSLESQSSSSGPNQSAHLVLVAERQVVICLATSFAWPRHKFVKC